MRWTFDAHTCPGFRHANMRFKPSGASKAFLVLAVLQSAFLYTVAYLMITDDNASEFHKNAEQQAAVAIYVTTAFLYFAVDSIVSENSLQFFSALMASLLLTVTFAMSEDISTLGPFWEEHAHIILYISVGFNVGMLALAYQVHDSFGYVIYQSIGADSKLQAMYHGFEVFFALLKLDIFAGLTLSVMLLVMHPDGLTAWSVLVGMGITLLWAPLCWGAMVQEKRSWFLPIYLWAPMEPAYVVLCMVLFENGTDGQNMTDNERHEFIAIGALALIIRAALVFAVSVCGKFFGQGLKERVFQMERPSLVVNHDPMTEPMVHAA